MDRAETGRRGEAAAARFYEKQGAALITHNYHTRMGEIDLILREPDGTLVFCEVKTRAKDSLDTPAAAVNAAKQRRIIGIRRMVSPKHPSERRAGAFRRGRSRPS